MKSTTLATLYKFCAAQDMLSILEHPWISGPYVYASNRHWMVRTALDRLSPEEQETLAATTQALEGAGQIEKLAPKAVEYFLNAARAQLAPMERIDCPPCATCEGTGRVVHTDCPACQGKGEFKHHGETYDCESCDYTGHIAAPVSATTQATETHTCPDCCGTGLCFEMPSFSHRTPYRGSHFALPYLAFLSSLPGIQFACTPQTADAPDTAGAFIFQDGFEGVLMPMQAPKVAA